MELEEQLEIDIENKYIKNKENTEFTIEEVLYILKRKYFCDEVEDMAINRIIKYIKEESIPKAVVEEQIGKINELLPDIDYHDIKDKQEREYYKKEFMKYITVRNYLQGLLKKGE